MATADVFVHNMRPQAIERLGFDYPAVSAIKPNIVYVGAYGFGQAGPYRAKPAYDDAIQAASGLASRSRMRDGTPQYVPAAIADKLVGVTLSQAVALALLYRERTGRGAVRRGADVRGARVVQPGRAHQRRSVPAAVSASSGTSG